MGVGVGDGVGGVREAGDREAVVVVRRLWWMGWMGVMGVSGGSGGRWLGAWREGGGGGGVEGFCHEPGGVGWRVGGG